MENTISAQTPPDEDPAAKKVAYGIYLLYLSSIVLPMLIIVGIIFAYIFENDAKSILKSHYQYTIRSFWMGIIYFGLSTALISVAVGFVLVPLCVIWWVIRMGRGLKSLLKNEPIANPKTWLF